MKQNDQSRNIINDLIRIAAMFLVIGVHWVGSLEEFFPDFGIGRVIYNILDILNSFGVPIFFSLSGYYVLRKEINNIRSFYWGRFVRVIIPFLLYSVIYTVSYAVLEKDAIYMIPVNYVVNVLTGNVHGVLWFVYSITGLYFATPFLTRMFHRLSDKETAVLYIIPLGFCLIENIHALFNMQFGVNTYVFQGTLLTFISGYCTQRVLNITNDGIRKRIVRYKWIIVIALFALYCISRLSIIQFLTVGIIVAGNDQKARTGSKIERIIEIISKRSYSIYLIHAIMISVILRIYSEWADRIFGLKLVVGYICVFALSLAFVMLFDYFVTDRIVNRMMQKNKVG